MPVLVQGPSVSPITATTGGVFTVIPGEPGAGAQAGLNLLGSNRLNGQQFKVKVSGYVTLAAGTYTATVQPLVYASTTPGFTAAVASAIYSTTAISAIASAAAAASFPFSAEITLEGDNASAILAGSVKGNTNKTYVTEAEIVQGPTAVNFNTEPPVQFAAGVTLANTTSTNGTAVVTLTQFQIVGD